MINKTIYDNGNSKVSIEFDGEVVNITQEITNVTENTVCLYVDELEKIYNLIKDIKD